MSTDGMEATKTTTESAAPTMEDLIKERDSYKSQYSAIKAKADELLAETKAVKLKLAEEAKTAADVKKEKALKDGDYQQLLKSAEEQSRTYQEKLAALQASTASEKIKTESLRIASELADGKNANLLSKFLAERLKYSEDGQLRVTDLSGNLTLSSLEDLKLEFAKSDDYKSLLRGNKSAGGGALGGGKGSDASGNKTMTRADYDAIKGKNMQETAFLKADFFRKGGTLTDS